MKLVEFQELNNEHLSMITGGGCSLKGAANTAVGSAIGGSTGGTATLPVVGTVAGWVAGGILGGLGGAVAYGATCWW